MAKRAPEPRPSDDPVIDEIRKIRADMWKEGGGTIEGYLRLVRERSGERRPTTTRKPATKPRPGKSRRKAG